MEKKSFDQNIAKLTKMATYLDDKKMYKMADEIDKIAKNLVNIKIAQYVGIQGYWLRNTRCWQNCYRQKRSETDRPSQEIWTECHEEYLKAINNPGSGWDKYAETKVKKFASKKAQKVVTAESDKFHKALRAKIAKGLSPKVAFETVTKDNMEKYASAMIEQTIVLTKIAKTLQDSGKTKMASSIALVVNDMVKEAGMWGDKLKGFGRGMKDFFTSSGSFLKQIQQQVYELGKSISQSRDAVVKGNPQALETVKNFNYQSMLEPMIMMTQKISDPTIKNNAQQLMMTVQQAVNGMKQNPDAQTMQQAVTTLNNASMGINDLLSQVQQAAQQQPAEGQEGQQAGNPQLQQTPAQEQSQPAAAPADTQQVGANLITELSSYFEKAQPKEKKQTLLQLIPILQRWSKNLQSVQ